MLSCPSLDHPVGRYESSETLTRKGQGRKKSGSAVRATVNHSRLCDFSNMHVSYNLLQCNIHFCVHVKIIFCVISILHQPVSKLISLNFFSKMKFADVFWSLVKFTRSLHLVLSNTVDKVFIEAFKIVLKCDINANLTIKEKRNVW